MKILALKARQILDSRGNPTVEVEAKSSAGVVRALVPSGASTGSHEAKELRDGGKAYLGKGVTKAVGNVNKTIAKAVLKKEFSNQSSFDERLLQLDGTPDKSKLGANAILGASMAFCRLAALENNRPLYDHIARSYKTKPRLPVIFSNVINGGKHAGSGLPFQEFMILPQAKKFDNAVEDIVVTYQTLKEVITKRYGKPATGVGDEGGFAPPIKTAEEALDLIEAARSAAGTKMSIAMDPASSEFYDNKKLLYATPQLRDAKQLESYYLELIKRYNVVSLEDPFEESRFEDFASLRKTIKERKIACQIVGDDLTVTNPIRIAQAQKAGSCDCLLLKVNQIGTVTESVQAAQLAIKGGWNVMVSHRSGETDDSFISHLAVGLGTGQIKIGAPCRGERVAKYNELLRISEQVSAYKPFSP